MLKLEDALMEHKYSSGLKLHESSNNKVKKLLFKQIQKAFKMDMETIRLMAPSPAPCPTPKKDEETDASPKALAHERRRDLDEELDFLPEFQELILIWHVATDIFLQDVGQFIHDKYRRIYVKAIKAVSDYMAFLAAVCPDMLPGLKLSSLHQATHHTLERLCEKA
ncbi:hypothetical protein BS78_05G262200 [Paspalum vaginatum]|nr:hypothetical protein BS78_05G262200 [Paspalum vaginatum]